MCFGRNPPAGTPQLLKSWEPPFADCFKGKSNARHLVSEHLGTKQVVVARLVSLKTFQTGGGASLTKRVGCPKSAFHSQASNPQFPWLHSPKRGNFPRGEGKALGAAQVFQRGPRSDEAKESRIKDSALEQDGLSREVFSASRSLMHPKSLPLGGFHPQEAVSPAFLTRIAGQLGWGVV